MSKILLFSLMLGCCIISFAQPCTPDNTLTRSGVFPSKLSDANINVAYSQVIQFKAPKDTTVYVSQLGATLPVEIDSIRIGDVIGLPPGLSYACHNSTCLINGGEVGCVIISGTSTEAGGFPLKFVITTSAKAILGTTKIPQTQVDTNSSYGLFVNWPTGLAQVIDSRSIKVYPNPVKDILTIEGDFSAEQAEAILYDAMGKKAGVYRLSKENYSQTIGLEKVPAGLYSLEIVSGQSHISKRLIVD